MAALVDVASLKKAAGHGYTKGMVHRKIALLAACFSVLSALLSAQDMKLEVSATPPAAAPAVAAAPAPAPRSKLKNKSKAPKKPIKKAAKQVESKYKSRLLSENTESSYRYDVHGNPIKPGAKKSASSEEATPDGVRRKSCSTDEPCSGKPSDADSL